MDRSRRKTSVEWPAVVDERLRLLVALVEQAGAAGSTSASELLAALICEQPLDGASLGRTVARYRRIPGAEITATTLAHSVHRPGPRRGRPRGSSPQRTT